MKLLGIIGTLMGTTVLSLILTLAVAAPAFAQEHEQQEQEKGKPAQEEKKAQPEKPAAKQAEKAPQKEEKNAKQEERSAQPQDKNNHPAEKTAQQQHTQPAQPQKQQQHAAARIPDDRYKANFGRQHTFRVSQGDYQNHRFQYGGYYFGFVDPWPSNWLYTQDVYVIEIDGIYYLCNPAYPGVNLVLSFTL
jgi:hypothetical protein